MIKAWGNVSDSLSDHVSDQYLMVLIQIGLLTAILFGIPIWFGFHLRGWDAFTHIFFSSGYANDWWSTWDPRWYGGFDKTSYPPLAHQIVALLMFPIGNPNVSYTLVLLFFLVVGPFAAFWFTRPIVGKKGAVMAALLFAFLPSIRVTLFGQGQFAGYVSVIFSMLAAGAVGRFLRSGQFLMGLTAALLAACSIAAHTATNVFFLPPLLLVTAIAQIRHSNMAVFCRRALILSFLFIIIAGVISFPLWRWAFDFSMQMPIPHPSRTNLLLDLNIAESFFLSYYGPLLIIFPISLIGLVRSGRLDLFITGFTALVFVLLGMGGTTKLPAVLFGNQWQWLTYERFNLWATIFMLPVLAAFFSDRPSGKFRFVSETSFVLLILMAAFWLINPASTLTTANPVEMEEIITHLETNTRCRERFLAFGFNYQLPLFSISADAKTLDGLWHTARSDPLLRQSGIGAISDALYWETGEEFLNNFMQRESPIPAYCIYLNENASNVWQYRSLFEENGWEINRVLNNGVSVWLNESNPLISESNIDSGSAPVSKDIVWGTLPLVILLSALSLIWLVRWSN